MDQQCKYGPDMYESHAPNNARPEKTKLVPLTHHLSKMWRRGRGAVRPDQAPGLRMQHHPHSCTDHVRQYLNELSSDRPRGRRDWTAQLNNSPQTHSSPTNPPRLLQNRGRPKFLLGRIC
mmetsp:Transcript_108760/g.184399  ORF Transcript_108760/g.184399 Transcript_108760/m.184399 type:complete len:120 (-) Transcript_108760:98-457(-)